MNEQQKQQTEQEQSSDLPAVQGERQLVPIELPEEHKRFYDKMRAKIEDFIREKGGNDTLAKYLLLAPDLFVVLARLMLDKRVDLKTKALAGAAVAYFITPLDFIPEIVTGPLGLMDDVVLTVYVLRKILVDVDQRIVKEHWNGEEDLLEVITNVIKAADDLVGKKVLKKIEQIVFRKRR
jgi:uncharacterized membrane protein YkvA (DUF1232 family)